MDDLENKIKQVEDLPNKQIKVKGFKFSGASIMALFALISTILGSLYGGFLLYQKVEALASLDLGDISSQMKKTSADVMRIEEHANTIKLELKKDMTDLRNSQWNLESKVDGKLQSVDTKLTNYDTKLDRFEIKVDKTKTDMEKRIQESWNFSLYNVYGRENAFQINFQDDPKDLSRTQIIQTSLFRWVPSVTYQFKF